MALLGALVVLLAGCTADDAGPDDAGPDDAALTAPVVVRLPDGVDGTPVESLADQAGARILGPYPLLDATIELHVACAGNEIVVVPLLGDVAGSGQEFPLACNPQPTSFAMVMSGVGAQELLVEVHADEDTRWALEIVDVPPTVPAAPEVVAAPASEPVPGKEVFEAQTDREGPAVLGPYTVTDDHLRVAVACVGPGTVWARTSLGGQTPLNCGSAGGGLVTGSVEASPPPGEVTVEIDPDAGVRWGVEVLQYPDAG